MKKQYLFGVLFFVIVSIAIINYRTPFLQQDGGGWSIGYGESADYPKEIAVGKNSIYSIEKLKLQNDGTVFLTDPFFVKEKDTFYLFFSMERRNQMRMSVC